MMSKFLKKFFLFIILVLVIAKGLEMIITHSFLQSDYYKPLWLNKIKNQNFDYVLLGNSRVYSTIDVGEIKESAHLNGINLGLDGSNFASQLLMLKIFYENNNQTKEVLLQVDPTVYAADDNDSFATYNFLPLLEKKYVFEHYKALGYEYFIYKYIPLVKYARFNFKWSIENLVKLKLNQWKPPYDQYGSYLHDGKFRGDSLQYFDNKTLPKKNIYLAKIIHFCQEKNIALSFFTAPYVDYDIENKRVIDNFNRRIVDYGIPYYNYHNLLRKNYNEFYDNNHINTKGVVIFNKKIESILIKDDVQ